MENIKLKRQQYAYNCVEYTTSSSYSATINNFGLVIYKNGLISALLMANNKEIDLYNHFEIWLKKHLLIKSINDESIIKILVDQPSIVLMALTDEALLLADALKEFTKAEKK